MRTHMWGRLSACSRLLAGYPKPSPSFAAVIMLLGKLDQIRGERFSSNQKEGHVGPDLRTKIKMTARFRKSFSRRGQSKSRHSR